MKTNENQISASCHNKMRGATLVETAIALPILIIFLFGIIEVLWFFHVRITLEYAAQEAVDLAAKLPFETPVDSASCSIPTSVDRCTRYVQSVVEASALGERLARFVAKPSSIIGAHVTLTNFLYYSQSDYTVPLWAGLSALGHREIAIVRPGEVVRYGGGRNFTWSHPLRIDDRGDGSTRNTAGIGWPTSARNETWDSVLTEVPLAAHLEATYVPLTPVFGALAGSIKISVTQYAFRNSGQKGIAAPYEASSSSTSSSSSISSSTSSSSSSSSSVSPECRNDPCSGDSRYCCRIPRDTRCDDCFGQWACSRFGCSAS